MNNSDAIHDLKELIVHQEKIHADEGTELQESFREAYESLRPINLIKTTLKEVSATPGMKSALVSAAIGMATGFIARKIVAAENRNPFITLLRGMFCQPGITHDSCHSNSGTDE